MDARARYSSSDDFSDAIPYPPASVWINDGGQPVRPLTKQVNQLNYELPQNKYVKNSWSYAPEFIKVFGDVRIAEGGRAVFDCMLLGSPRPKVCWLFNDEKMAFDDVEVTDTADLCRLIFPQVRPHHYGVYTLMAENEAGRAVTSATLLPISYGQRTYSPMVTDYPDYPPSEQ